MNTRVAQWLRLAVTALALTVVVSSAAFAGPGSATATEDILFMADGRELHGQIISETKDTIVFRLVDVSLGLRTSLTLHRDDIGRIERGVPVAVKEESTVRTRSTTKDAKETKQPRYGRARHESDHADVPTIYVVPVKGQMGTDIHKSIYEKVIEDIKAVGPDIIVFELDSSDYPDLMIPQVMDPRDTRGVLMFDEYREMVNAFKDELADTRQVMWVQDSVGFSSLIALSWSELYMSPDARLAGLRNVIDTTGADKWSDPDVRAKMSAAIEAFVKMFLEYGGYGTELAEAMLWPESKLSASFQGRTVQWSQTDLGEYVVDNDDEKTVWFRAKVAEDLLISDGTVETLEDLAFLLGYREFREVGATGQALVENYVEKWQKVFDQTIEWQKDYYQHMGWASGEDTLKYLGRAKRDFEQIISAMNRYKAVEIRWRRDQGVTKEQLEIEVEKMKEQIRSLKRGRRGGGVGGSGGGFGGG